LPGSGRKRALIIAVAAATTTAALGILLAIQSGSDEGRDDRPPQDDIPVLQPLQPGATPGTATPEPQTPTVTIEPDPKPEQPPPVQPIEVEVTSDPAGAKVFAKDSDEELGVTPFTYEAPPSDGQVTLRLELQGYKAAEISFRGDRNGMAQLALQKESRRDKRPSKNPKSEDEFGYR
jgi:hypothetical protein